MTRRNKTSTFEDIIDIVALLPWWLGAFLALLFYLTLHYMATLTVMTAPSDVRQLGANVGAQLWHVLAGFLQYLIPAACLIGSGISAYKEHERDRLHEDVAISPSRNALESMSWHDFEKLVGEIFRRKGFTVEERGGNGPDGGVDLVLHAGHDKYLVQCKQWKADRVGVATVRELYGVMTAERAVGGFVVTSGQFTEDAEQFAEGRSIELIGTDALLDLIRETAYPLAGHFSKTEIATNCPECGAAMIKRTAKKGRRVGEEFWGCSRYPQCKGLRPA